MFALTRREHILKGPSSVDRLLMGRGLSDSEEVDRQTASMYAKNQHIFTVKDLLRKEKAELKEQSKGPSDRQRGLEKELISLGAMEAPAKSTTVDTPPSSSAEEETGQQLEDES